MKEWVPGSYILYEKNPYYWDAEKVTVNTVKFVLMEDANASYSAYKTGEIMMAKDIPSEEVPSLMEMCIRDSPGGTGTSEGGNDSGEAR